MLIPALMPKSGFQTSFSELCKPCLYLDSLRATVTAQDPPNWLSWPGKADFILLYWTLHQLTTNTIIFV